MLIGVSVSQLSKQIRQMFAYLRSNHGSNYRFITTTVATNMRDHVRNQRPLLSGLNPSDPTMADMLAEIYMREFACTLNTLQQVNQVAARYHEHAFDNTDTYTAQEVQPAQLAPHEMTAEQRYASQLLLGVGRNHTEVNAALKSVVLTARDVTDHNVASMQILAQQFQENQSVAEDAFDRLQHVTKQVWNLVNMMAFSNLFRFADPRQPICIPNQDDAIFIPFIPTKTFQ